MRTRNWLAGALVVLLTMSLGAPLAHAQSLEELVEATGLDYMDAGEGVLKIVVEDAGAAVIVGATETPIGEEILFSFWVSILEFPNDYRPDVAFLTKLAELNGEMSLGRVSLIDRGIYYRSELWQRGADATIVSYELALAYTMRSTLRQELLPFTQE